MGNKFILTSTNIGDWINSATYNGSKREINWTKTDGTSICPVGFRVPTHDELYAETRIFGTAAYSVGSADLFRDNNLKIPTTGYRFKTDGNIQNLGYIYLWSSDHDNAYSDKIVISTLTSRGYFSRANGLPIRCIKN